LRFNRFSQQVVIRSLSWQLQHINVQVGFVRIYDQGVLYGSNNAEILIACVLVCAVQ